jgi:hypothetical protein
VKDLEGNVELILDFCGLCIRTSLRPVTQRKRAVPTASSEPGSPPIFRHGLFQWKNYEPPGSVRSRTVWLRTDSILRIGCARRSLGEEDEMI